MVVEADEVTSGVQSKTSARRLPRGASPGAEVESLACIAEELSPST
jgi:hypothetical protein